MPNEFDPYNLGLRPLGSGKSVDDPHKLGLRPLTPEKSWYDTIKDQMTVGNAIRMGGSTASSIGGGALMATGVGAPVGLGVMAGGAALSEGLARWYEGKDFNPWIMATEGGLNVIDPFKKFVPGPSILGNVVRYAGREAAQGGLQGLAGTAPRKWAEEGIYDDQGNIRIPSASEFAGQTAAGAASGAVVGPLMGGALGHLGRVRGDVSPNLTTLGDLHASPGTRPDIGSNALTEQFNRPITTPVVEQSYGPFQTPESQNLELPFNPPPDVPPDVPPPPPDIDDDGDGGGGDLRPEDLQRGQLGLGFEEPPDVVYPPGKFERMQKIIVISDTSPLGVANQRRRGYVPLEELPDGRLRMIRKDLAPPPNEPPPPPPPVAEPPIDTSIIDNGPGPDESALDESDVLDEPPLEEPSGAETKLVGEVPPGYHQEMLKDGLGTQIEVSNPRDPMIVYYRARGFKPVPITGPNNGRGPKGGQLWVRPGADGSIPVGTQTIPSTTTTNQPASLKVPGAVPLGHIRNIPGRDLEIPPDRILPQAARENMERDGWVQQETPPDKPKGTQIFRKFIVDAKGEYDPMAMIDEIGRLGGKAKKVLKRFLKDETGSLDIDAMYRHLKNLLGRDPSNKELDVAMARQVKPGETTGRVAGFPPKFDDPKFEHYQLPDGRIVPVDSTASKGAETIPFQLKGGEVVDARRIDQPRIEPNGMYGPEYVDKPNRRTSSVVQKRQLNDVIEDYDSVLGRGIDDDPEFEALQQEADDLIYNETDRAIIDDNLDNARQHYEWAKLHGTPDQIEFLGGLVDTARDKYRRTATTEQIPATGEIDISSDELLQSLNSPSLTPELRKQVENLLRTRGVIPNPDNAPSIYGPSHRDWDWENRDSDEFHAPGGELERLVRIANAGSDESYGGYPSAADEWQARVVEGRPRPDISPDPPAIPRSPESVAQEPGLPMPMEVRQRAQLERIGNAQMDEGGVDLNVPEPEVPKTHSPVSPEAEQQSLLKLLTDDTGAIPFKDIFNMGNEAYEWWKKMLRKVAPEGLPSVFKDAWNAPSSYTTTGDDSGAFRQALTHFLTPEFWKAIPPHLKAMRSRQDYDFLTRKLEENDIFVRPFNPMTGKEGPSIADRMNIKLRRLPDEVNIRKSRGTGKLEESIQSSWIENGGFFGPETVFGKKNYVRMAYAKSLGDYFARTNRGFVMLLNHISVHRAETLANLARNMAIEATETGSARMPGVMGGFDIPKEMFGHALPEAIAGKNILGMRKDYTPEEAEMLNPWKNDELAKQIGGFVNAASGRGSFEALEKYTKGLSNIFFSPRLIMSRLKILNPWTYVNPKTDPFVRKQYLQSLLSLAAAWGSMASAVKIYGEATGNDVSVSWDPTNSDFGKMRIGNTRIDPGGGFLQFIVAAARMIEGGYTSSNSGEFHRFGSGYQATTQEDSLERFFVNKLNPMAKMVWDIGSATDKVPFHVGDRVMQLYIPLIFQDMVEILQKKPELAPLVGITAFFGAGTQTYEKGESIAKFIPKEKDWLVTGGGPRDLIPGLPSLRHFAKKKGRF